MDADRLLAIELQTQFDDEEREAAAQEKRDSEFANSLAQPIQFSSVNASIAEQQTQGNMSNLLNENKLLVKSVSIDENIKESIKKHSTTNEKMDSSSGKHSNPIIELSKEVPSYKDKIHSSTKLLQNSTSENSDKSNCTADKGTPFKVSKVKPSASGRKTSPSIKLHRSPTNGDKEPLPGSSHSNASSIKRSKSGLQEETNQLSTCKKTPEKAISQVVSEPKQKLEFDQRPVCRYGTQCYRKNVQHLREYKHEAQANKDGTANCSNVMQSKHHSPKKKSDDNQSPTSLMSQGSKVVKEEKNSDESQGKVVKREDQNHQNEIAEPPCKKIKLSTSSAEKVKPKNFAARVAGSAPYHVFVNKCFSVKATHSHPRACVLFDLLHPSMGTLVESVQINYLVDMDFLHETYEAMGVADKPLLIFYGELSGDKGKFKRGLIRQVVVPDMFGVHHTKMMLLFYDTGMRVVVHTSNLRPDDWYEKTQGVWVSPLFPKMEDTETGSGDSPTQFRHDLLQYLQTYENLKSENFLRLTTSMRRHDFSQCNAVFIGHVPGRHKGPRLDTWGHLKLRRVLKQHCDASKWRSSSLQAGTTIVQCSSIGSLGKDCDSWLSNELGKSLNGGVVCPARKIAVIYPTEDDIRQSSQGWGGGSCLPYNSKTDAKQFWLRQHMHNWRSGTHTSAMPHVKSYTRLNSDGSEAQYLLLTSANLSKAAWGQMQKQDTQLFIRSYEAGVLLLPRFVTGTDGFPLSGPQALPLPYDLPLTPYSAGAIPWVIDTVRRRKDVKGNNYLC